MKTKYHSRSSYEQLYGKLYAEERGDGAKVHNVLSRLSDYQLLNLMNHELERLGCMTYNAEELEMELH
jgi:hypothetical protein